MPRSKKVRSFRVRLADWLAVSREATLIEWSTSVVSLVSVIVYVAQTYLPPNEELSLAQHCFNFFFMANFLLRLYAAESRLLFLTDRYTCVDYITIMPSVVSFVLKKTGNSSSPVSGLMTFMDFLEDLNFFRVVRMLKLKSLLVREVDGGRGYSGPKMEREVFFHILQFFVVMFCFSGLFMVVENRFAPESMRIRRGNRHTTFHDSFYFIATLLSTVGYGDIIPMSIPGKFLVMLMIISSLAFVGDKLNKISSLISMHSPYARAVYSPGKGSRHVVVCGSFTPSTIEDFLSEFFHKDHGVNSDTCNVVLLAPHPPNLTIKLLLELDKYFTRVVYIEGFVMREKDLARAKAELAECVFILANKDATNAKAMDAATVFRAMSIKKYVRMKANKDVFVIMQLIQSSSKIHFQHSCYGGTNFQIVCTDELKQGLLAKSCLCPGFSTMVSNLITSSNIEAQEHMETWVFEYVTGCSKEVYRARLSRTFEGKTFGQVSSILFANYNCTLFALEIVDSEGCIRIVLNPSRFEIPSGSVYGYLIAEDSDCTVHVANHDMQDLNRPDGPVKGGENSALTAAGLDHMDPDVGSPWHRPTLNPADTEVFMPIQEAVSRKQRIFHYLNEPRDLKSACPPDVESMTEHILLLGNAQSMAVFIETLRQRHVTLKPIVVLCPELPTEYNWTRLRHFPKVYFIQGSQKSRTDLVRAGVLGVDTAVIISMDSENLELRISEDRGGGRLLDSECLFAYQAILKYQPNAKVICQLRRAENILFLSPDLARDIDVMVAPPFASGAVYLSAMLDRLTCQCFYNRNLLTILQALVSSSNCTQEDFLSDEVQPSELCTVPVPPSFEGKTYIQLYQYLISKKDMLPVGLYRRSPVDDVSPQPYVITNPPTHLLLNARDSIFALLSPVSIGKAPLGDIVVAVVEAEIPRRTHNRLGQSAYIPSSVACLIESEGETSQTDKCANVLWPHWNFITRFSILDSRGTVEVTVFDAGRIDNSNSATDSGVAAASPTSNCLGRVVVPLSRLVDSAGAGRQTRAVDEWFPLHGKHCDGYPAAGTIRLQLSFHPSRAAAADHSDGGESSLFDSMESTPTFDRRRGPRGPGGRGFRVSSRSSGGSRPMSPSLASDTDRDDRPGSPSRRSRRPPLPRPR